MFIHVVEQDDSIYKLANYYKVSLEVVIEANGLDDADHLVVGQSLVIPNEEDQMERKPKDSIIINGYTYPFLDLEVLAESLPYLSYLSIFSYEARPDGSLSELDDQAVLKLAERFEVSPRMVVSNIAEESGLFDKQLAHEILASEKASAQLIHNTIDKMREKNYPGVDLDFENLDPEDKDNYNRFIQAISNELHENQYTLSAAIEKKASNEIRLFAAHDYKIHGLYDDLVILMTYDWGYLFGPPMAISPAHEVEKVLQYAVTEIPSEKILMGIPNYAFDWTLPYEEGDKAAPLSHVDAVKLAKEKQAEIAYDDLAQSPYFYYYDEDKKEHVVWFEDARSIYAKLRLVKKYNLGGVSYWTVNKSFPQNWSVLKSMFWTKKYR